MDAKGCKGRVFWILSREDITAKDAKGRKGSVVEDLSEGGIQPQGTRRGAREIP